MCHIFFQAHAKENPDLRFLSEETEAKKREGVTPGDTGLQN